MSSGKVFNRFFFLAQDTREENMRGRKKPVLEANSLLKYNVARSFPGR